MTATKPKSAARKPPAPTPPAAAEDQLPDRVEPAELVYLKSLHKGLGEIERLQQEIETRKASWNNFILHLRARYQMGPADEIADDGRITRQGG